LLGQQLRSLQVAMLVQRCVGTVPNDERWLHLFGF
jgi:hypothetical protein